MEIKTYIEIKSNGKVEILELTQSYLNYLTPKVSNFSIFKIVSTTVTVNGKLVELKSDRIEEQSYKIGKFYSVEDIYTNFGEKSALYRNVAFNGLRGACYDNNGCWQAVNHKDIVLDPATIKFKDQLEK